MRGQTDLRSVVRGGIDPAHRLLRNASSMSGLSILPTGHMGTPCASTLRQQVRGVIHKSPGRPHLEATLHAGERPSCVGPEQSALATHVPGKIKQGANILSRNNVTSEEWTLHRLTVQKIWEIFGKARVNLRLQRQLSLPNLFYKEHGCPGPRMAQPSALCLFPNRSATAGTQASQGTTAQASCNSPPLEEPIMGVRIIPAADGSPVANPLACVAS